MKIDGEPLHQFLQFWKTIAPPSDPEMTSEWVEAVAGEVRKLPDEVVEAAAEIWAQAYADTEASLASVRGRAANLLLAVGILSGLGAVTATASGGLPWFLTVLVLAPAALVAFFALGTAFLAIRAQQVRVWTQPHLRPGDVTSLRGLREKHATDLYVADRRNRLALADVVGYLRGAQTYALMTLASLVLMTITTVATASATRSPNGQDAPQPSGSGIVSPAPSAG